MKNATLEYLNEALHNVQDIIIIKIKYNKLEKEIKELLNRYKQSKQMMKASKGRGMRQLLKKLGAN